MAAALTGLWAAAPAAHAAWPVVFQGVTGYDGFNGPYAMDVADVTGDGRNDVLATVLPDAEDPPGDRPILLVYAQRRDGTLAPPVWYPSGTGEIATGDLDGDGDRDVVTADGPLVFRPQTRRGTLGAPRVATGAPSLNAFRVADMDGDGRDDVVGTGIEGLMVAANLGHGRFRYSRVAPAVGSDLEVADLNGDRRLDVVESNDDEVLVHLQRRDGRYRTRRVVRDPQMLNGIAVADVTGDGRTDLAYARGGNFDEKVVVLRQDRGGRLAPAGSYDSYDIPSSIEARDLDGDGRTDLAVAHVGFSALGYYLQRPDGTFEPEHVLHSMPDPGWESDALQVRDVTCDGRPDLVTFTLVTGGIGGVNVVRQAPPAAPPRRCPRPDLVPASGSRSSRAPAWSAGRMVRKADAERAFPALGGWLGGDTKRDAARFTGVAVEGDRLTDVSIRLFRAMTKPYDRPIRGHVALRSACGARGGVIVPIGGRQPEPAADGRFTLTGRARVAGGRRVRITLQGEFTGTDAIGTVRIRGCRTSTHDLALRSADIPVLGSGSSLPRSLAVGRTRQPADGLPQPMVMRVGEDGRHVALRWEALARCGRRTVVTVLGTTGATRVRRDGTFGRAHVVLGRDDRGGVHRLRVTLRGRLVQGHGQGVLTLTGPGGCRSGWHHWGA